MSKRRPATPAKDTITVEPNVSLSKIRPASTQEIADAKLLEYIHDERHFSFVRYPQPHHNLKLY
jgi:hypothetical protein